MTGKKYLNDKRKIGLHDFFFILRKYEWIFFIGVILFGICIPFFTAGLPGDSIFNIEVTHDQMKFRLIHENAIWAVIASAIAMGLLISLSMFRFVHDKKESTIFLSMGMTRTALYRNRVCAGILILTGSIVLPMMLSLWLNIQALGMYTGVIRNTVYLSIGIVTVSYISFAIAAIASFLSGTIAETLVGWATGISIPIILCYGMNQLMKTLFWGNAWGETDYTGTASIRASLVEQFSEWNPILFFVKEIQTHAMFYRPLSTDVPEKISWKLLIIWIGVTIVLVFIGWITFSHRKAEVAGISGLGILLPEAVIGFSGFLIFSVVFSYLYPFQALLGIGLGFGSFVINHIFWRKTLFGGSVKWKKTIRSVIYQSVMIGMICMILSSGFFQNPQRFFQNDTITEAKMTYVGAPAFLYEKAAGSTTGRGYYLTSTITGTKKDTIDQIKKIQQLFLDSGRKEKSSGTTQKETVIPYDITFQYKDENGKEHIWYYDRVSYEQLEAMLALEDQSEIKDAKQELFTGEEEGSSDIWAKNAYSSGEIFLSDRYFSDTYALTISDSERKELLLAIQTDLSNMTLEEQYFPDSSEKAVLMFSENGEYDCTYFSYHLDNEFLYLTDQYENTLSWLEKQNLLSLVCTEPKVESIYLQKMDPYIGMNAISSPIGMYFMSYCADTEDEFLIEKDFGNKYEISDQEEIASILPGLRNGYYMTRSGYLAAVKLSGKEKYRYLFLPAEFAPDHLQNP